MRRLPDRMDGTGNERWRVVRLDDNGHRFVVVECQSQAEAQRIAEEMGRRGHKQAYWVEIAGAGGAVDSGATAG